MSLSVCLEVVRPTEVYWSNITHDLYDMALEAGIYDVLWRPEALRITQAHQLIKPLEDALEKLRSQPYRFREYNPPNGHGSYEEFVQWIEEYLDACRKNPMANVRVNR